MPGYPVVRLKKGKQDVVARRHPWIFSGAIGATDEGITDGDVVEVQDHAGSYICTGHFQEASIRVRILSFEPTTIDKDFWLARFSKAYRLRQWLGLGGETTNAYRLINAEGDGLPGLVIDVYDSVAVVQCHSIGMHRAITSIAEALAAMEGVVRAVYDKSRASLPGAYAESIQDAYLWNEAGDTITASENGLKFEVNIIAGQKTGFFLDQRENRKLLSQYSSGKTVLNAFSYTGGFSVYALQGGAGRAVSVDISPKAIEAADRNVSLNGFAERHESVVGDVVSYLKQAEPSDIIILDPPAYAKSLDKRHNAVQGYKRLNLEGLRKVKPGGMLFTFSCSQVVDRQLFYNTITAAAIESGREVKVLHHTGQPADHPVNIFHPEGHYLKGLILQVY
jgi:23S rRNA (cytosine1962-C5)-methyltransferase